MLKSFGSFLLRLWAGFLHQSFPNIQTPKETRMSISLDPDILREQIRNRAVQCEMIEWIDENLRPLENDEEYLKICRHRPFWTHKITTKTIQAVLDRMEPFMVRGTPAHGLGHHTFDFLTIAAWMSNDEFVAKMYQNEKVASFFAALHDGATGIQHRYTDDLWELNHGEIFAYVAFHALKGLLSYEERLLLAYLIAAHPHLTKDKPAKNMLGVQKVWNDTLFFNGDRPVRYGVWLTRGTDRLSNGGDPATHFPRHATANLDAARIKGTTDIHHILGSYSMRDQLPHLFTPAVAVFEVAAVNNDGSPVLKDGQPVMNKIPSMLKHLEGYAKSATAFPYSAYNLHDHRSVNMTKLMGWKIAASAKFIDLVTNTTGSPDFGLFVELMQMNEGLPNTEQVLDTIEMVRGLWNVLPAEDQAHWAQGFEYAMVTYYMWLNLLQYQITQATDPTVVAFQPLIQDMVARVTK